MSSVIEIKMIMCLKRFERFPLNSMIKKSMRPLIDGRVFETK